jgi:hypothetical protein
MIAAAVTLIEAFSQMLQSQMLGSEPQSIKKSQSHRFLPMGPIIGTKTSEMVSNPALVTIFEQQLR